MTDRVGFFRIDESAAAAPQAPQMQAPVREVAKPAAAPLVSDVVTVP